MQAKSLQNSMVHQQIQPSKGSGGLLPPLSQTIRGLPRSVHAAARKTRDMMEGERSRGSPQSSSGGSFLLRQTLNALKAREFGSRTSFSAMTSSGVKARVECSCTHRGFLHGAVVDGCICYCYSRNNPALFLCLSLLLYPLSLSLLVHSPSKSAVPI